MIIVRRILFLTIAAVLYCMVTNVFCHKEERIVINQAFFKDRVSHYEVLGIGSSYIYCTLDPICLYREMGIRSFILASPHQQIEASYHYLKQALKHQKPELVILEGTWIVFGPHKIGYPDGLGHTTTDAFPIIPEKSELIRSLELEGPIEAYYIPFLKYHSRWKELGVSDFRPFVPHTYDNPTIIQGYQLHKHSRSVQVSQKSYANFPQKEIFPNNLEYFEKIRTLVEENGAKLLVVFSPKMTCGNGYENRRAAFDAYAAENGIPVLDFNTIFDEVGFDAQTDFADATHMNVHGAEKATKNLADYLRNHYVFHPDISDESRMAWEQDCARYDAAKSGQKK